jgi:hypothetical protein
VNPAVKINTTNKLKPATTNRTLKMKTAALQETRGEKSVFAKQNEEANREKKKRN